MVVVNRGMAYPLDCQLLLSFPYLDRIVLEVAIGRAALWRGPGTYQLVPRMGYQTSRPLSFRTELVEHPVRLRPCFALSWDTGHECGRICTGGREERVAGSPTLSRSTPLMA